MKIKICGITEPEALEACIAYGADFAGFVFAEKSPRFILREQASTLSQIANKRIVRVGLFVDPTDEQLQNTLEVAGLEMIQLHGSETPGRVAAIKDQFDLPIIKAIPVETKNDLELSKSYQKVTKYILLDTKSEGSFGGTGRSFDWSILEDFKMPLPWMLAGGLDIGNIGRALSTLSPDAIDISSGVEDSPGIKNPAKIKEFIETARKCV